MCVRQTLLRMVVFAPARVCRPDDGDRQRLACMGEGSRAGALGARQEAVQGLNCAQLASIVRRSVQRHLQQLVWGVDLD